MKNKHGAICLTSIFILLLTLNSCIGISLSIQMNKDGSAKLTMEYRISKMIYSLGALDGNESMPDIPIAKADWDRTISRVPGAKLTSYSSSEDKQDTVTKVVIDCKNDQSLLLLLDAFADNVSLNMQGQSGKLDIILLNASTDDSSYDEDMMDLVRIFMDGYDFSISFSGPGNSTLAVTDGFGKTVPAQTSAKTVLSGKSVSYSIGIIDLLDMNDGLGLKFAW